MLGFRFIMLATPSAVLSTILLSGSSFASELLNIRNITYAGSGCPASSLTSRVSDDKHGFELRFNDLRAEAGPGLPLRLSRKNCQLLIDLEVPTGYTYALSGVTFKGSYDLDAGAKAEHRLSTYFSGNSATNTANVSFQGPRFGDYEVSRSFAENELIWAPCGSSRAINLNTSVRVSSDASRLAYGAISVDPETVPVGHFELVFKSCAR